MNGQQTEVENMAAETAETEIVGNVRSRRQSRFAKYHSLLKAVGAVLLALLLLNLLGGTISNHIENVTNIQSQP